MTTSEITAGHTQRGWLSTLFGAAPAAPARWRPARRGPAAEHVLSPDVTAALLGIEFTEDRARAATSGFEMGEYEPCARRN